MMRILMSIWVYRYQMEMVKGYFRQIKKSFKNQKQSSTKIFKRNTPSLPKEWIQLVKSNE